MKARSRQAPVRPAVSRPASMASAAVARVVAEPSVAAAPWERWLDHPPPQPSPLSPRFSFALPDAADPPTLPSLVQDLLAGRVSGMPIAPARDVGADKLAPAVRQALQTPDLCLWNRAAGFDPSIACVEFVRHAVESGLRILYLAASPAPIERTLAKLAGDPGFLAVRFSAPGERASNGPLTRFSLEEQRTAVRVRLLARAAEARAALETRRLRLRAEADVWESLSALVREIATLDARLAESERRLEGLPDEVRREADALTDDGAAAAGPFASDFALVARRHRDRLDECDRTLLPLRDHLVSLDRALTEMTRERNWLDPLLSAYRAGQWWSLAYWKARFNVPLRQHGDSVLEQEKTLRADRERVVAETTTATAQRQSYEEARNAEVTSLVAAEVGRRHGEIESQLETLRRQRDELAARWQRTQSQLARIDDRPTEPTLECHRQAFEAWQARTETPPPSEPNPHDDVAGFLERMPALAPVVAGTTFALERHHDFAAAAKTRFDLVLIDDADQLAEDELLDLLGRAPRALVIGTNASASTPFAKLWKLLHVDSPSTYQWSRLDGGYLCTLGPVAPADQPFVESERLADFPEIELRILSAPKQPPRLVQVVFPARLSAVEAKTFIYRELQEAAVDRVDRPKQFLETADQFLIAWDCPSSPREDVIDLEPGLREAVCVHDDQLTTCRIEFDKSAGWDHVKIQDWLRRHLPALDAPRTADLS